MHPPEDAQYAVPVGIESPQAVIKPLPFILIPPPTFKSMAPPPLPMPGLLDDAPPLPRRMGLVIESYTAWVVGPPVG